MDKLEADVAVGTFPAVHLTTVVERVCTQAKSELVALGGTAEHHSDETKYAHTGSYKHRCCSIITAV